MEKKSGTLINHDPKLIELLTAENSRLKEQLNKRQMDLNKTNSYYKGIVRKLTMKIGKLSQAI